MVTDDTATEPCEAARYSITADTALGTRRTASYTLPSVPSVARRPADVATPPAGPVPMPSPAELALPEPPYEMKKIAELVPDDVKGQLARRSYNASRTFETTDLSNKHELRSKVCSCELYLEHIALA